MGESPISIESTGLVTNGAIGGNFLLFYTFVGPGDHVIIIDPSYQQLSRVSNVFSSGNAIKFPLSLEDDYRTNLENLSELIAEKRPSNWLLIIPIIQLVIGKTKY